MPMRFHVDGGMARITSSPPIFSPEASVICTPFGPWSMRLTMVLRRTCSGPIAASSFVASVWLPWAQR